MHSPFLDRIASERKACFFDSKAFLSLNADYESVCGFGRNIAFILDQYPQVNAMYLHGPCLAGKTTIVNETIRRFARDEFVLKRSRMGLVAINGRRNIFYADFGCRNVSSQPRPLFPRSEEMLIVEHPDAFPIWMLAEHRVEIDVRVNGDKSRDVSAVAFNKGEKIIEILKEMYK